MSIDESIKIISSFEFRDLGYGLESVILPLYYQKEYYEVISVISKFNNENESR